MSKTFRDRRKHPKSDKRCPEATGKGCVCCCTGEYKRIDNRARRRGMQHAIRESLGET